MTHTVMRTVEDVRYTIEECANRWYPGKTVDEVLEMMDQILMFTVEDAIRDQMTDEEIRSQLYTLHCCDTEYHPEEEFCDDDYSDPKDDMGFWRTGIRVSFLIGGVL